jgi:uncharacterized protein
MGLQVDRPDGADAFLERAGAFLAAREAEHNLLFGICTAIRVTPELFAEDPPRFAVVADGEGRVLGASLRTPPRVEVVSEVADARVVDALVHALRDEPVPGVLGPKEGAARFAERWHAATGQPAQLELAERIFRLDEVVPPGRPASGSWRLGAERDREIVAEWLIAFVREALPGDEAPTRDEAIGAADRWIAGVGRQLYVWDDGSQLVSMLGAGGETPNGIRIGPVYTPPDCRGRGYATSLTAAASQDQLDRGRRFCFLFTDLANPTSNRIYQRIGYQPVCDLDQYRFEAGG